MKRKPGKKIDLNSLYLRELCLVLLYFPEHYNWLDSIFSREFSLYTRHEWGIFFKMQRHIK